jgi:hypothetical protein
MTSSTDLVGAVAAWLEHDLLPTLDGRDSFQTRVAAHALRIVERELASPSYDVDRAALAEAARDGTLTPDDHEALVRDVLARIAVDSPGYATLDEARDLWPDHLPPPWPHRSPPPTRPHPLPRTS